MIYSACREACPSDYVNGKMAGAVGLEPTTYGFGVAQSGLLLHFHNTLYNHASLANTKLLS